MFQFIRRGRFRLYIVTAPGIINIAFIHALILIYHKLDLFLDRRDFSVLILICNGEFYLSIIAVGAIPLIIVSTFPLFPGSIFPT